MLRSACSMLLGVAGRSSAPVVATRAVRTAAAAGTEVATRPILPSENHPLPDRLFRSIELEYRGHDKAVLSSYTRFLETVCRHLELRHDTPQVLPYVRWVQPLLRSKFVHKKYKLHYETRTHITKMKIHALTGSTASALLEYVERNVPEGVGMKVSYDEALPLPESIQKHLEAQKK